MKVLFIGNYRNSSGWSTQAINTILAMDSAGIEVIPRHINIISNQGEIPNRILELEKRSIQNPDIVFLNTLPHLYERQGLTKYVAFYVLESSDMKASGWPLRINMMDAAINCCGWNKEVSQKSGITVPISVVNQAIDVEAGKKDWPIHHVKKIFENDFIFYTVGDWSSRKNVEAIIKAFHLEFYPTENVQLLIKTLGGGNNPIQEIQEKVNHIKNGLKLYRNIETYKKELIIAGQLSNEEVYSLHKSLDCYVSASHAEAFSIPTAVSMSFYKPPIVPCYGGFLEYCDEKNAYLITGQEDYISGATDTLDILYTGREKWFYPSINSLRQQMRLAFENRQLRLRKIEYLKKNIYKLSYQWVGERLKLELEKTVK